MYGDNTAFCDVVNIIFSGMGYRDEEFYVPALFYTDDGLLLARSCTEAEDMIGVVVGRGGDEAGRCGLDMNKEKSNLSIYRNKVGICDEGIYRNVFGSMFMFR